MLFYSSLSGLNSGTENSSALGAASGQDFTAVGGLHSCAKTVDLAALALLGMIGAYCCHGSVLLSFSPGHFPENHNTQHRVAQKKLTVSDSLRF